MNGMSWELHTTVFAGGADLEPTDLPWCETLQSDRSLQMSPPPLVVGADDGLVWAKVVQGAGGRIEKVAAPNEADAGFCPLAVGRKHYLGLLPIRSGILVNGSPSLSFNVLTTRDSVLLRSGFIAYITSRVLPFVGKPTDDLLGKKCRFCGIPIEKNTRVVACACGQPFHHETAESHPEIGSEQERLGCFEKVSKCLTCGKDLAIEPFLLWDPGSAG